MKKLCFVLAAILSSMQQSALAESNYYIDAKIGGDKIEKLNKNDFEGSLKAAPSYEVAGGINATDRIAFDLKLTYKPQSKSHFNGQDPDLRNRDVTFKITSLSATINGYYYLTDSCSSIIPYIGAGVGFAKNTLSKINTKEDGELNYIRQGSSTSNFAKNVMVGSLFPIDDSVTLVAEYKYADLGKIKSGNVDYSAVSDQTRIIVPSRSKLRTHAFMLGLRYNF